MTTPDVGWDDPTDVDDRGESLIGAVGDAFWRILDDAGAGVVLLATDTTVVWANEALADVVGVQARELVGRTISSWLRLPGVRELGDLEWSDRGTARVRGQVDRPDGRHRVVTVDLWSIAGKSGRHLGWFATVTDRTRRLEAEAKAIAQNARYADLFAHAPVGLSLTTPAGIFIEANDTYHRLLGLEPGSLVGRSITDITVDDDVELSLERMRQLVSGEVEHYSLEKRYRRADGSIMWAELHVAAVHSLDGQVELVIGLINDISDRRRAEHERARAVAELEQRNDDLRDFTAVASHDLKSPLQTIIGYLETLPRTGSVLDESGQLYVDRAVGGARRMERMINGLLAFARSGTAALDPQRLSLDAVVAGVVGRIRTTLAEAGDVDIEIDDDLGSITADRVAIDVVVQNLLVNALRYRREDVGLHIHISAQERDGGTLVHIADNGTGVPVAERETVFAMYHRAEGQRRTGSGIGLATCRRLVDRHGGRIWLEDGIDTGTAVAFWLPGIPTTAA